MAGSIIPDKKQWPRVFFAFKHNDPLLRLTQLIRDRLDRDRVWAYRLVDDPHPGTNLRERATRAIQTTDGLVLFWSQQARESAWVRSEYDSARIAGKPVCLVRFPGVTQPTNWNPDVEWVDLDGVLFARPNIPRLPVISLATALTGPVRTLEPAFGNMVRKVGIFARDSARTRLGSQGIRFR